MTHPRRAVFAGLTPCPAFATVPQVYDGETMATLQKALLVAFDLLREGRFSRSRRPSATISPTPTRSAATRRRRFPQPRWSGQPLGGGLMFATLRPLLTQSSTDKTQSSTGALEGCLLDCDARLRALFR